MLMIFSVHDRGVIFRWTTTTRGTRRQPRTEYSERKGRRTGQLTARVFKQHSSVQTRWVVWAMVDGPERTARRRVEQRAERFVSRAAK